MHIILFSEFLLYYLFSIFLIVTVYNIKPTKIAYELLAVGIYAALALPCTAWIIQTGYLTAIPLVIYHIVSLRIVYKPIKIRSLIAMFLLIYSINVSIASILIMCMGVAYDYQTREFINLVALAIMAIISLIIIALRKTDVKHLITYIPPYIKRLTILSVLLSAMIVQLISDYNTFESVAKYNILLRILLTLLMVCFGTALPLMISAYMSKTMREEQLKNYQNQIQIQAEHYKTLSENSRDIRRFRHDFNNMKVALQHFIKENNPEEAAKLIQNFNAVLNHEEQSLYHFDTGNGIADALLAEKQSFAEKTNATIEFDGVISQDKISPTDLCVILGNTLDNAIEAGSLLSDEETKVIKIICKSAGGCWFFKMTNPVKENVIINGNTIPTTKRNKQEHGFGLYSLHKTVDKYNGVINMHCENNIFCTEIMLPINI